MKSTTKGTNLGVGNNFLPQTTEIKPLSFLRHYEHINNQSDHDDTVVISRDTREKLREVAFSHAPESVLATLSDSDQAEIREIFERSKLELMSNNTRANLFADMEINKEAPLEYSKRTGAFTVHLDHQKMFIGPGDLLGMEVQKDSTSNGIQDLIDKVISKSDNSSPRDNDGTPQMMRHSLNSSDFTFASTSSGTLEESARSSLNTGQQYPYDADDEGNARDTQDWAVRAARGIVADLTDRRGIKWGFNGVDHDARMEIVDTLAEIIRVAHSGDKPD